MTSASLRTTVKPNFGRLVRKDFLMNKWVYLMALPVIAYYLLFCYWPMYGAVIAFQDYRVGAGFWGSPWVGLKHFESFFRSPNSWLLIRNTFLLSLYSLLWGFPMPIIFALMLNELRSNPFKRFVQSMSYLPHFISMVVIAGMVRDLVGTEGLINTVVSALGGQRANMLLQPQLFRTIYISSGVWTGIGWGSIIYLAALTGIDPALYEAAVIDGAGRWKQMVHITLPSIVPTIVVLLILDIGSLMSVGFEKVMLLYNPVTYETADVIATYVYRRGLEMADYSFATAVGLMNSAVNFALIIIANTIARKWGETSLW
jgi:putative aldouronate transport system permease protein